MPGIYVIAAALLVKTSPEIGPVIPFVLLGLAAYETWFGWRLSEVWLDGDVLQVKGPGGSLRVPLANVLVLESRGGGRVARVAVLRLGHPVGGIDTVRFIPTSEATERDLQAGIHAARSARKT
jgi:hypothetical protein